MDKKLIFLAAGIYLLILAACSNGDGKVLAQNNDLKAVISAQSLGEIEVQNNNENIKPNVPGSVNEEAGYQATENRYTDKAISIAYPQITGLKNEDMQIAINNLLKKEALSILDAYEDTGHLSLEVEYKITLQSPDVFSVQFFGMGNVEGTAHPLNLFYTANIDMYNGSKLRLKDLTKIDKHLINEFKRYKVKDPKNNEASVKALQYILETYSDKDLMEYFEQADTLSANENPASVFSYLTEEALGISIGVPHVFGDHVEAELRYEAIKGNIISTLR